jgi:hypothetical protein
MSIMDNPWTAGELLRAYIALSFKVRMDDFDQILSRDYARIAARRTRIDHVLADVILDHLGDEAVQRAATGSRLLQHARAFVVGFHRTLDGINLAPQAFEPIQQFGFLFRYVTHCSEFLRTKAGYPSASPAASMPERAQ